MVIVGEGRAGGDRGNREVRSVEISGAHLSDASKGPRLTTSDPITKLYRQEDGWMDLYEMRIF